MSLKVWSEYQDSNLRPLRPERSATLHSAPSRRIAALSDALRSIAGGSYRWRTVGEAA